MKKFLSVALLMIIVTTGFLIGSKHIIGDKKYAGEGLFEELDTRVNMEFLKYEETDTEHQIFISLKNNYKKIIGIYDIQLSFANRGGGYVGLPIDGQEYHDYSTRYEEESIGIDPGEKTTFVFKIPKEVYFDKTVVNFDSMLIQGFAKDYMFRVGNNTAYGGFTSWSCRAELQNTGEPIVIDKN